MEATQQYQMSEVDSLLKSLDHHVVLDDVKILGVNTRGYKSMTVTVPHGTPTTVAFVSPKYRLVNHKDMLAPVLESLASRGFVGKASNTRLRGARLERGGARAVVELGAPELAVEGPRGQFIFPRWTAVSAYDKTSANKFNLGAFVRICGNGMSVPYRGFEGTNITMTRRHDSDAVFDMLDLKDRVDAFLESFPKMVNQMKALDVGISSYDATEIVGRHFGIRGAKQIINDWEHGDSEGITADKTKWELYMTITQFLRDKKFYNTDKAESIRAKALSELLY